MERNRKFVMTEDDRSDSATALFAPRKEGQVTKKLVKQQGSLEIIENGERKKGKEIHPSESSQRSWSRASIGSVPPRSDSSLSRRTITPTKQISLQAVKRKEESSDPFIDDVDIDFDAFSFNGPRQRSRIRSNTDDFQQLSENSFTDEAYSENRVANDYSNYSKPIGATCLPEENFTKKGLESDTETRNQSKPAPKVVESHQKRHNKKDSSSEDENDDDDDDKVKLRAPNELLMEFVDCLMKKDFPNADKLCKMILLYEPENPEALKFQPLIQEKMQLDAEAAAVAEEEGDSDDEDDDDSDDSDDDDDDTTSSDTDSSEEDDDDDDDDEGKNTTQNSQILSGNLPSSSSKDQTSNGIKGANSIRVWKPAS